MNVQNCFQALISKRLVRRYLVSSFVIIMTIMSSAQVYGQGYLSPAFSISVNNQTGSFPLVNEHSAAPILIDEADAEVVRVSATCFADDIEQITQKKPLILSSLNENANRVIIVGTVGKSKFIDRLLKEGKIKSDGIRGSWETYSVTRVQNPLPGVTDALVIAGSDRRGAAFGLFELSRLLGVSPWTWWADAAPEPRATLYLQGRMFTAKEPSVKYRGIFLNDEDWGLQPWAARNMDIGIKDLGPKAYAKIFELMLRLRANTIWPAMHDSTKPFWVYPDNPIVADRYGIIIGSTHCDMLHRSNTYEWQIGYETEYGTKPGEYRYDNNRAQVQKYWEDRVREAKDFESMYTIGMRGVRDGQMSGPKAIKGKIALLDTIFQDQRQMLKKHVGSETVPQIFVPYKEVLQLYNAGLEVPEDVTLIWTDDNYGYLRRLSTPEEQKRSGGSGIYYHLSYMGKPHDYLWLSSTSPSLISYEMTKAYQFGADRFWVVNVGDIKPGEMEIEFFLDLAYDVDKWQPEHAHRYAEYWAGETFGDSLAKEIASIKAQYYDLTQACKAEHSRLVIFDAATRQQRIERYLALEERVRKLEEKVPGLQKDAFFELVAYPVYAASLLSQKIYYAQESFEAGADKQRVSKLSMQAKKAYMGIKKLTSRYTQIENGKWTGMITDVPRDIIVYGMPDVADPSVLDQPVRAKEDYDRRYNDTLPVSVSHIPGILRLPAATGWHEQSADQKGMILVKGLGLDGESVSRYPFTGISFSDEAYQKAPHLSYQLPLKKDTYILSIKALPTRPIHKERHLRLAIVIDGQEPQFVDVNNNREGSEWSTNVRRGFAEIEVPITINSEKPSKMNVYLLDTGIALNRFDIYK